MHKCKNAWANQFKYFEMARTKWGKLCKYEHTLEQGLATIFVLGPDYGFISFSRASFQSKTLISS